MKKVLNIEKFQIKFNDVIYKNLLQMAEQLSIILQIEQKLCNNEWIKLSSIFSYLSKINV